MRTVRRRTEFRLAKCEGAPAYRRGRPKAFAKIDDIIKLIRASEDQAEARSNLQKRFKFSERQAEDIVNLRLGQLTRRRRRAERREEGARGRAQGAEGHPRRREGAEEARRR